jgi:hypothetical protein
MNTQTLSIIFSLLILSLVIELVRRERLTFKYAAAWILVSLAGIFLAAFDHLLWRLAEILGFQLMSNFIFFAALCGFVFLSLLLTVFLCQQNDRNDKIAQKLGIVENELEQLRKREKESDGKK